MRIASKGADQSKAKTVVDQDRPVKQHRRPKKKADKPNRKAENAPQRHSSQHRSKADSRQKDSFSHPSESRVWRKISQPVKRIKISPPPKNDSRKKNLFEILQEVQDKKYIMKRSSMWMEHMRTSRK